MRGASLLELLDRALTQRCGSFWSWTCGRRARDELVCTGIELSIDDFMGHRSRVTITTGTANERDCSCGLSCSPELRRATPRGVVNQRLSVCLLGAQDYEVICELPCRSIAVQLASAGSSALHTAARAWQLNRRFALVPAELRRRG